MRSEQFALSKSQYLTRYVYPSAQDDYSPRVRYEITFPPGSRQQLYNVTILNDIIPENSEFFNADVYARPEDASFVIIGSPKQPLIEILDLTDGEWPE